MGTGASSSEYPVGVEYFEKRDDALYSLVSIDDLFSIQLPRIGDHTVEATLYGIQNGRKADLVDILSNSTESPELTEVLNEVDIFVSFLYSDETDYFDGMTIKSKHSLSSKIEKSSNDLMMRFLKFEEVLKQCDTVPSYLQLLATLVDGDGHGYG